MLITGTANRPRTAESRRLATSIAAVTREQALHFERPEDFEAWLEAYGDEADEVWIRVAKKGSSVRSLSVDEAVEVALCFGWIDSLGRRLDDEWFLLRLTPRRPRSNWSARNRERAEALIAAGRMRPAGLAEVERARADGRWGTASR
jgi:uncharacterized protein YdeI (YjbR/CyaY-like superfamily)